MQLKHSLKHSPLVVAYYVSTAVGHTQWRVGKELSARDCTLEENKEFVCFHTNISLFVLKVRWGPRVRI